MIIMQDRRSYYHLVAKYARYMRVRKEQLNISCSLSTVKPIKSSG